MPLTVDSSVLAWRDRQVGIAADPPTRERPQRDRREAAALAAANRRFLAWLLRA